MPRNRQRDLVPKPTAYPNHNVLPLSEFRLALIKFLKLPMGIGETALRKELERASPNVLRNYLARVQREAILQGIRVDREHLVERLDGEPSRLDPVIPSQYDLGDRTRPGIEQLVPLGGFECRQALTFGVPVLR